MNVAHIVSHYFRNIVAVAVCLIAALGAVSAQTESMLQVAGTIKDEDSGRKLPGCVVVVFQDGTEFDRLEKLSFDTIEHKTCVGELPSSRRRNR